MRRLFLAVLLTSVLAIGAAATSATAAPTGTHLSLDGHAQLISPTTLVIGFTLTCPPFVFGSPPQQGVGFVSVQIQEKDTGTLGFGFSSSPCDGSPHDGVVVVNGGPFTPGNAIAVGNGCGFLCDTDIRQIQIVV